MACTARLNCSFVTSAADSSCFEALSAGRSWSSALAAAKQSEKSCAARCALGGGDAASLTMLCSAGATLRAALAVPLRSGVASRRRNSVSHSPPQPKSNSDTRRTSSSKSLIGGERRVQTATFCLLRFVKIETDMVMLMVMVMVVVAVVEARGPTARPARPKASLRLCRSPTCLIRFTRQ